MTRVLIIQELLAQYRLPFYEGLKQALDHRGIELDLVYGKATGERALRSDEAPLDWGTPVRNRNWHVGHGTHAVWQPALPAAKQADLVVVEHANRQLVNYVLLGRQAARRQRPELAFWGHGGNLQAANPNSLGERFKRWTAKLPHWWFAYTEGAAERVAATGFPRQRITVVQNAIDTSPYTISRDVEKIPHECVFLGSLHEHKRIEFLLEAGESIATRLADFQLTVIGDGPQRPLVEKRATTTPWLNYRGALFGETKASLVSRASLMLIPGLVGLGVLDAFAALTPLVTTAVPFHSPEFEYIRDGGNGDVLPGDASPTDYAARVITLLQNPERLARLRDGCAESAEKYTIERMVSNFANGISACLGHA